MPGKQAAVQQIPVLHLVDSLNLGGIQALLLDVLPRLRDLGIACEIASLHGPGPYSAQFEARGISPLHLGGSKFDLRIPFRLARSLDRDKPCILHTHGAPSCFLGEQARRLGYPGKLVEHVHHIVYGQRRAGYQDWIERSVYRRCDLLIGCSSAALGSASRSVRSKVIYNGVDEKRFCSPTEEGRRSARARLGFKETDFVVGMSGRLTRLKGQHLLCAAAAVLKQELPNLKVLFVGSGPDEEVLRQYCVQQRIDDRVYWAGYQQDVREFLYGMDAFVMASESEGLGIALLEAMSTGLPCIASAYPAANEILTPDEDGILFKCGDFESLASALARVVSEGGLRQRIGNRARMTVSERFSLSNTVNELYLTYLELAAA